MALILDHVALKLAGDTLIRRFSLEVGNGEIVTLMGPSGSGKSSLLSFIAGDLGRPFEASGRVILDGRDLAGVPVERRAIGRLFQDDLLFPHLTIGENLLFGMPSGPRASREALMREALAEAGLDGFAGRPPHTLSGGQRSRVALMRALVAEPKAMLLDEPFNKLDKDLRAAIRSFVFDHVRQRGIPCLMVTHDRDDAPPGARVLTITRDREVKNA